MMDFKCHRPFGLLFFRINSAHQKSRTFFSLFKKQYLRELAVDGNQLKITHCPFEMPSEK